MIVLKGLGSTLIVTKGYGENKVIRGLTGGILSLVSKTPILRLISKIPIRKLISKTPILRILT